MALNEQLAKRIGALEQQARKRDVYERHIPYCVLWLDQKTQTIPDATNTLINFDLEIVDVGNLHSTTVNNSRITVVVAGLYLFTVGLGWEEDAAGYREVYIQVNGTAIRRIRAHPFAASTAVWMEASVLWHMDATDYAEVVVYQNSGGAIDVLYTAYSPMFAACLQG